MHHANSDSNRMAFSQSTVDSAPGIPVTAIKGSACLSSLTACSMSTSQVYSMYNLIVTKLISMSTYESKDKNKGPVQVWKWIVCVCGNEIKKDIQIVT